ncbi:MAG: glycosyltransferase [Bacteroidales bacterium]|jgi:glycosyltransferase involved in cell wall biosynthesis|nr:glycosyltransferase [Bacteroidales bacterium]
MDTDTLKHPEFSVVVPVFNSSESLEELTEGILQVFQELNRSFQIIFIDDRSTDDSWKVLFNLKEKYPQYLTLVRLAKNFGQHNATLCGMQLASGEKIITIDDDLQTPPAEIKKLIAWHDDKGDDVVYGISRNKNHHFIRTFGSRLIKFFSGKLRNTPGEGSSFRLIAKPLADKLRQNVVFFVFIDEILLWYTENIGFVEVLHLPRKYNHSGYTPRKLLNLVTNLVIFYTDFPLKLMVYGGFFASFISFIMGLVFIIKKLFFNVPLGYTSLIVAILFSTSITLLSLGIIGEYLSRIYKVQNRKPPFSIDKII